VWRTGCRDSVDFDGMNHFLDDVAAVVGEAKIIIGGKINRFDFAACKSVSIERKHG
jgi:hypothetical protein